MAEARKVTFEVPAQLRRVMDQHPEINWSAVFRQAIRRQAEAASIAERILEEQSDPRVQEVTALVKRRVGARFRATERTARRKR